MNKKGAVMVDFMVQAQGLHDELIERRRDLHRHPELAFEEIRTAGIVAEALNKLGMEVQTGVGKTGVVGILEGGAEGPTVLVRADMDALPIHEANETDYASTVAGKMHACGHDGHVTIALGVAKLLAAHREQIKGRIKFVFQPGEEVGTGARSMLADGVLANPKPDVSLGLHLWNELPLGQIGMAEGPVMAAASDFKITICGKGGHGAVPQQAIDPVTCAAHLVTALQTIVSRNVDPLDTAVVSVTQIHTGTAFNVIPDEAVINGTFRTFRRDVRDRIEGRMRDMSASLCAAMECESVVEIQHYTEAVRNHPDVVRKLRAAFAPFVPDDQFVMERTMAGEDVGLFMDDIPGTFFFVGSANAARQLDYPHHHARFDFDEAVLPFATGLLATAVAQYVMRE